MGGEVVLPVAGDPEECGSPLADKAVLPRLKPTAFPASGLAGRGSVGSSLYAPASLEDPLR